MRVLNFNMLSNGNMAGNLTSSPMLLEYVINYSIQCIFTGSPTGTMKLQGSNDPYLPNFPTNWTDITGSSTAVTSAGSILFNAAEVGYNWVQVVYTASSGSGSLTIQGNTKGA